MKASDLRIGNQMKLFLGIGDNGAEYLECEIQGIMIQHGNEFYLLKNTWVGISNNLEPIPLTEEWHNKFGVELNRFKQFVYTLPGNRNIDVKVVFDRDYIFIRQGLGGVTDDIFTVWNKDVTKRDMYVHEWQNLYHALTGEELTYEK